MTLEGKDRSHCRRAVCRALAHSEDLPLERLPGDPPPPAPLPLLAPFAEPPPRFRELSTRAPLRTPPDPMLPKSRDDAPTTDLQVPKRGTKTEGCGRTALALAQAATNEGPRGWDAVGVGSTWGGSRVRSTHGAPLDTAGVEEGVMPGVVKGEGEASTPLVGGPPPTRRSGEGAEEAWPALRAPAGDPMPRRAPTGLISPAGTGSWDQRQTTQLRGRT